MELVNFVDQNSARLLRPASMIAMLALMGGMSLAQTARVPTIDHLPPGELLSEAKEIPPEGVELRAVYAKGIALTKLSEGWVPHLYNDAASFCTIGYGHLIQKAPCDGGEPAEFRKGISKPKGEELLVSDLATSRYAVMTDVHVPLSDGQFAALADFVFNVGSVRFRDSTLLRVINSKQLDQVPGEFRRWVKAGNKVLAALERRREREVALFFEGLPKPKSLPQPGKELSPIDIQKGEGSGGATGSQ
jgi:GH24 family phage-related lysozyme (muramidase)